jgi:hypothetical protein
MNTASVSNPSCVASGPAKGAESGPWCDRAIAGCMSMALLSHTAARPVGYSCPPSLSPSFLSRWPPLRKNKEWGQTSTFFWSWIKRAGTRVPSFRFLKDSTCSFCHPIRQNFSPRSGFGRFPMSRLPIGSSTPLMSWNRSKASAVAGFKLILSTFVGAPPFIGGLLL